MKQARFENAAVSEKNLSIRLSVRQGGVWHGYVVRVPLDHPAVAEVIGKLDSIARRKLVEAWGDDPLW